MTRFNYTCVFLLKRFASYCSRTDAGANPPRLCVLLKDTSEGHVPRVPSAAMAKRMLKRRWDHCSADCVRHKTSKSDFTFIWNNHSLGQKELKIPGSLMEHWH